MILSLSVNDLTLYLSKQLENFFPDGRSYDCMQSVVSHALEKVEYNFKHIKLSFFWHENHIFFNHLNADQYTVFIYYASNIAYESFENKELASKLFCLNKALHSVHCMYDTKLPDIFLVLHGVGVALGKACYSNYFVAMQGITVGANSRLEYPTLGEKVVMYPNSSLLGNSHISESTCLSNGAVLQDFDTEINSLVIGCSPNLIIKKQRICKSNFFFKEQ